MKPRSGKYLLICLLLDPLNSLFSRTTLANQCWKCKTNLDLNEARDDGVLGCSGISWTICIQSAPRCRRTTTPIPHHSIFTGRMLFLTANQQCHQHTRLPALFPGLPGWSSTRKVKPIRILLKPETVSGSGIGWLYASMHLAPDRLPRKHPTTQFFTDQMPFLLPNHQRQSTEGCCQSTNNNDRLTAFDPGQPG